MKDKVKKALKRVASGLMAAIFAVCLVGTPRVKAVAVVDDVAVGAMSCEAFLASIGLPLTATGGASAVTSGIAAAAGEYAAATGAAASGEAFLGTVAAGTAISTAGAIVLTAAAAVAVGAFAYWLYDKYLSGVSSGTDVNIYDFTQTSVTADDGTVYTLGCYVMDTATYHHGTSIDGSVSFGSGKLSVSVIQFESGGFANRPYTSVTLNSLNNGFTQSGVSLAYLLYSSTSQISSAPIGIVGKTSENDYNWFPNVGITLGDLSGKSDTQTLTVRDFDFVPIPEEELGPTKQMVIDVGAAPGTTLDDLAQSVPDAIANGQFAPTYVIQVAPSVDPVPVPVPAPAPEVDPTPEVDAPEDIAPYTVGLGEVFPFCIPFDIYHMVTMFAAEPQAPAATWEFTLPWSGQECEVSWSLEEWDEVAKLCRSLELVLFCVGLAAATYKMIKW